MIGPICCDLSFEYGGFIKTFFACTLLLVAALAVVQIFLPDELNTDYASPQVRVTNEGDFEQDDVSPGEERITSLNLLQEKDIGVKLMFTDSILLQSMYHYFLASIA